jgi:hypothetical protein
MSKEEKIKLLESAARTIRRQNKVGIERTKVLLGIMDMLERISVTPTDSPTKDKKWKPPAI